VVPVRVTSILLPDQMIVAIVQLFADDDDDDDDDTREAGMCVAVPVFRRHAVQQSVNSLEV